MRVVAAVTVMTYVSVLLHISVQSCKDIAGGGDGPSGRTCTCDNGGVYTDRTGCQCECHSRISQPFLRDGITCHLCDIWQAVPLALRSSKQHCFALIKTAKS
jgi:hypothetical protein